MKAIEAGCNPFGFPTRNQHVSGPACAAIIKAARTVDQINYALEVIGRIEQTPVKVALPAEPSTEISPACKNFFDALARAGQAADILKVAGISGHFRREYPAAVKWAESQRQQIPIIA